MWTPPEIDAEYTNLGAISDGHEGDNLPPQGDFLHRADEPR
jgi:hypothetical protein